MSANAALQFVDTNILVYAHDRSAGVKHIQASDLLLDLWQTRSGCLSIQVLQEFYVTITRKVAMPLAYTEAAAIVGNLTHWRVYAPGPKDLLGAIDLEHRCQISFWDAMIVHSAARLGCKLIWSEDFNPGQIYDGIRLLNPFA